MTAQPDEQSHATSVCGAWSAVHDFMPGNPPTLRVTGECTFPTAGYSVTLTRAEPQGINPFILILDKTVTPPTGLVAQVVTTVAVKYEEETSDKVDQVHIRPDGTIVDVQIVK